MCERMRFQMAESAPDLRPRLKPSGYVGEVPHGTTKNPLQSRRDFV